MNFFGRSPWILLLSLSLIIGGILLVLLRHLIFDSVLTSSLHLNRNSPIMTFWKVPPLTVSADFYLFNWTNPEDIYNTSVKPKFQEVGPFRYSCHVEKVNISWNHNFTVTFRILQEYYFDEKNSKAKLTDNVTTINPVVVGAIHSLRDSGYFTKSAFSLSLSALSPQIHVTKTADELLFKGYRDPYLDLIQTLPFLSSMKSPVDKAGFLYGRNNSYMHEGIFNVANGKDANSGEIIAWNFESESQFYKDQCKNLRGSIGEMFKQKQDRNSIRFFLANVCRNLVLDYEEDVVVKNIEGYKYSVGHSALDNGTISRSNKCLCNGKCMPYGVMNVSSCAYDSPTFLSLPHFYKADPVYLNSVEGLKPDKERHEMFLTIEPRMGVCIDIGVRLQSNFLIHPVKYISLAEHLPNMMFPVIWSSQRVSIPDQFVWMIRVLLHLPNVIIPIVATIFIVAGVIIFVLIRPRSRRAMTKITTAKNENGASEELLQNGKPPAITPHLTTGRYSC